MKSMMLALLALSACTKQFWGLEATPEQAAKKQRMKENPDYACESQMKTLAAAERVTPAHDDEALSGIWSCNLASTMTSQVWNYTWKTTSQHGKVVIETRIDGEPALYQAEADGDGMIVHFNDKQPMVSKFVLDGNILRGDHPDNDEGSWTCQPNAKFTCTRYGI